MMSEHDQYVKVLEDKLRIRDEWLKNIRRQLGWWFTHTIGLISPLEKAEAEIEWLKKQVAEKEQEIKRLRKTMLQEKKKLAREIKI